jgi:hypothetical protein
MLLPDHQEQMLLWQQEQQQRCTLNISAYNYMKAKHKSSSNIALAASHAQLHARPYRSALAYSS